MQRLKKKLADLERRERTLEKIKDARGSEAKEHL
jgi:hypothetical protein